MNQQDEMQRRHAILPVAGLGALVALIAGVFAGAFADFGTTPQAFVIALVTLLGLLIWLFNKYFIKAIGGPISLGAAVCGALFGGNRRRNRMGYRFSVLGSILGFSHARRNGRNWIYLWRTTHTRNDFTTFEHDYFG